MRCAKFFNFVERKRYRCRAFAAIFFFVSVLPAIACERSQVSTPEPEPSHLLCLNESGRPCERPLLRVEIREGIAGNFDNSPPSVFCVLDRESFIYKVRDQNSDLLYLDTAVAPHGGSIFTTPSNERAANTIQLCMITFGKKISIGNSYPLRVTGAKANAKACDGRQVFVGLEWSNIVGETWRSPKRYVVQMRVVPD